MTVDPDTAGRPSVLSERVLAQGRHFAFSELTIASRSGGRHTNQIVRHPGAVTILPILDGGNARARIVFVENYRAAVDRRLLELPAGKLEAGEDPAEAAGRELIEESGFRAGRIEPLSEFFTTPGLTDERMFAFVARDLVHVGQSLEEDEDLIVRQVPLGDALRMASDGTIEDAKTSLVLLIARARGVLGAVD